MIELVLIARLQALAGGRVFAGVAPKDTPTPRVTYAAVGFDLGLVLGGRRDGTQTGSLQVDVWADSRFEALQVTEELLAAMTANTGDGLVLTAINRLSDETEESTGLERVGYEFSLTL